LELSRRARWELRTIAGRYPAVAGPLIRRSGNPISPETDVVIEGFPRTGNTFAVTAFVMAQPGFVSVAHHVHVPAQVISAERLGVPALLLWGEDDPFAPVAGARRFAAELTGAELVVVPGTGHFVYDDAPEETAEALGAFLSESAPR
jgi:pimeloyl-ACP methyl ester carboxylesterase